MGQKIAVILFPGTNCELEALRALKRSGMTPELIRWNENNVDYSSYDGFFLPGGFSYEDRGRSGVIASKNPLLEKIKKESEKGKPILGVCNGAQIILEAKLIPGLDPENVEMALAWNKRVDKNGKILGTGFFNEWIYIRSSVTKGRSAFNNFPDSHVMRIPVAHAEGRYTTLDNDLQSIIQQNEQNVFSYCDPEGKILNEFPINPNGAMLNIAGICNPDGNVLALMPHPERTINGQAVFDSMKSYIDKKFTLFVKPNSIKKRPTTVKTELKSLTKPQIEIFVDTLITDNEERTIEQAIHEMGYPDLHLKKRSYFGIYIDAKSDPKKLAIDLIQSGEIANLAKEVPYIIINGKEKYDYNKEKGLVPDDSQNSHESSSKSYITIEQENTIGKNILQTLQNHFAINGITSLLVGKQWNLETKIDPSVIIGTQILHNPHSTDIYTVS